MIRRWLKRRRARRAADQELIEFHARNAAQARLELSPEWSRRVETKFLGGQV